ncbi:MAG TPA: ElyC/SanA/YdcF family protein [Candidatus Sulfomarinibacteraceae bacterium]|nr:ElyC/SanA/YdcF family protein [Candidatus Sulfomarinibacteraceae bacterium]
MIAANDVNGVAGQRVRASRERLPTDARAVLLVIAALVIIPFLLRGLVVTSYGQHVYEPEEVTPMRVAIVFGAAIDRSGQMGPLLRDRMDTAIELYEQGKVERLLLSGVNHSPQYNEPGRMLDYALARNVPPEALQPDYGGHRTYHTCYRARYNFQLEEAILVTQEFHLLRALYTCDRLGVQAVGVVADRRAYHPRALAWLNNRELLALVLAVFDVTLQRPAPLMGDTPPF